MKNWKLKDLNILKKKGKVRFVAPDMSIPNLFTGLYKSLSKTAAQSNDSAEITPLKIQQKTPAKAKATKPMTDGRITIATPDTTLSQKAVKFGWKQGWREVGGKRKFFRSAWEYNYALYLEFVKCKGRIKEWEHEVETFWFDDIKRGTRSYLPDFKITENNGNFTYHEVKGFYDAKSKTKIKRMAKFYPNVKLLIIDAVWFKANSKKLKGLLPNWE
jgi:hypothetical protein